MYLSCGSTCSSDYGSPRTQYRGSSVLSRYGIAENVPQSFAKAGYKFGEFKDSHNWVECDSKSAPGEKYFFNVRSKCRTWVRPVPDDVPLQHFNQSRLYESDPEQDERLMTISDSEQEADDRSVGGRAPFFGVGIRARDVLQKLYHGVELPDSDSGTDEDFDEAFDLPIFQQKTFEPAANALASTETRGAHEVPGEASEKAAERCLPISDFLEVELRESTRPVKIASLKRPTCETSSSECDEDFEFAQHFAPRLHKIQSTDLVTRKKRKYTKKKIVAKGKKPKVRPTIRNMYGITTINYNSDYECQLDNWPAHVKVSNLSDTSVGTTRTPVKRTNRVHKYFNRYRRPPSEVSEIHLSESSSSSSCSSDCSCCSSSSQSSSSSSSSSSSTSSDSAS